MKKEILCGLMILSLTGCAVTAERTGDFLKLEGWGASSASWEKDGEKYSISKSEPIKVPDILPTR